jgi:hypothetical protein
MANPFPGMDPYLESDLWPSVHDDLISEIVRRLSPQIKPKYIALSKKRVVVATPDPVELGPQARLPDVGVMRLPGQTTAPAGGAALAAPLELEALAPESITLTSVEIHDVAGRRLVTAIELLSPTNKRGEGEAEYADKRRQLLRGPAHLLEIDLLRLGTRFPLRGPLPSVPYFVFLSRAGRRPRIEVWPIPLDQPLPTVPVPLLDGDADAVLDLQTAFQAVYEIVGYDLAIDYRPPPPIPLAADQEQWADGLLRAAGKRP